MLRLVLLLMCLLLVACGGLSKEERARANATSAQLKDVTQSVEQARDQFQTLAAKPDNAAFKPYIVAEKLSSRFEQATQELSEAQAALEKTKRMLSSNNPSDSTALRELLNGVEANYKQAQTLASEPEKRLNFLKTTSTRLPALNKEAAQMAQDAAGIKSRLTQAVAAKQKQYPSQTQLQPRLLSVLGSEQMIAKNLTNIKTQLASAKPNLALVGDAHAESQASLAQLKKDDAALRASFRQLDTSQSKTLVDMKFDLYCQVGRSSWSETSEYDTENAYTYQPVPVNEADFEVLDAYNPEANLADYMNSSLNVQADPELWKRLNINPDEAWSAYDDSAVYFVQDMPVRFFHKYRTVENGKASTTDWVEVNEAEFTAQQDNLGMDIQAKPYGMFQEQSVTSVTPPGMSYVGNSAYGNWSGSGAGRTWIWLPIYRSYPVYAYGDYLDWDSHYRGKKAYYGKKDKQGAYGYGSGSSYSSRFYGGSNYVRQGSYGGSSVRGAGPGRRGGGPGGGGK